MAIGDDVLEGPDARTEGGAAAPALTFSAGVLSFGAHQTITRALQAHRESGLVDCAADFFVYFNAITDADREIATQAGVRHEGSPENLGIYGGFRAIAEHAKTPYVLILENDIVPLPGARIRACIESCLSDMAEAKIKTFCLRSRSCPGEGGPHEKYVKVFGLKDPIVPGLAPHEATLASKLKMFLKHGDFHRFRSSAIYCERDPEKVQKDAIRKLPSGNYVTNSRYRNWSNQAVLVEREYFLNVVCRRVEEHPDPRLVNGRQDIERAMNRRWWRRRRDAMGHAAEGVFTHRRLDR
jgi:glycosyltransferase involved in cell wall biosynthesis